jgi:hypothetical protein
VRDSERGRLDPIQESIQDEIGHTKAGVRRCKRGEGGEEWGFQRLVAVFRGTTA